MVFDFSFKKSNKKKRFTDYLNKAEYEYPYLKSIYNIKREEIKEFFPISFNMKLAEEKGLSDNGKLNDKFFRLISVYCFGLNLYVNCNVDIMSLEKKLKERGLKPIKKSLRDVYHRASLNEFFYVRNTLYVEKLSVDDINQMLSNCTISDILKIVERTYRSVITTEDDKLNKFNLLYEVFSMSNSFFAPNDALVIGICVKDKKINPFGNGEAWLEKYSNERSAVSGTIEELESAISNVLNIECRILEYSSLV